jgi:hypothetical protein
MVGVANYITFGVRAIKLSHYSYTGQISYLRIS